MKPYRESEFKNKKMTDGFNSAIEGVFETIRTEKHMKFHAFTTILVIVLGLFINLSRYELLALIISTSFVWLAELFNTAIECCVDLTCQEYNLLAKKQRMWRRELFYYPLSMLLSLGIWFFQNTWEYNFNKVFEFLELRISIKQSLFSLLSCLLFY